MMRGGALAQLPVFLAVAEQKSFTAAARLLRVSPSAVSQAIARLERELGATLVLRTTRSVNLTEAGARLAAEARPALGVVEVALDAIAQKSGEPQGVLRLNVPRLACQIALPPLLAQYAQRHPEMRVDVTVEDRNVDIVREGFDAGIRLREAVEKDMVTVRLSPPIRFVVVGSKRYLAARGRPKHPRELVDHACIAWRCPTSGELYRWEFEQRGRALEVDVDGPISSNDADVLSACAELGLGLAYVAEHEVRARLRAGKLETVLEPFCPEVPGLFLYYPRAAQRVAKLAAFVEVARNVLLRAPRTRSSP
jgi:DNA-binding transcriptional LysR family regulator